MLGETGCTHAALPALLRKPFQVPASEIPALPTLSFCLVQCKPAASRSSVQPALLEVGPAEGNGTGWGSPFVATVGRPHEEPLTHVTRSFGEESFSAWGGCADSR